MPSFRTGHVPEAKRGIDALQLPVEERQRICLELLTEFGAQNISIKGDEIIHSCNLPFGNHANGDRNPSAHLNFRKMVFGCWACGGGGFLWWIATMLGDERGNVARDTLARVTGLRGDTSAEDLQKFLDQLFEGEAEAPTIQSIAKYQPSVLDKWNVVHPYLTEFRGIPEQNVVDSRVGYGEIDVRMGDNPDGTPLFKRSQRIVIPHFWKDDLVGWQSRRLIDDGTPKYVSTPAFPREQTLYNYDATSTGVVVVEAPLSCIAHRDSAHMEATFGASVTTRQMDLLAQHEHVVLWMDQDGAGWQATETMCEYLSTRVPSLYVVDCPYAADPADLTKFEFRFGMAQWSTNWMFWQRPTTLEEYHREEVRNGREDGAG